MEKIARKITQKISDNNSDLSDLQIRTIKFGLECLLGEISKIGVYCIVFYFMGFLNEFFISILFFSSLRLLAGGFHEDTYLRCLVTSFLIFLAIIFAGTYLNFPFVLRIVFSIVSIILVYIYAPVDHPNKPIISKLRRKRFKYSSILVCTAYCIVSLIIPEKYGIYALLAVFSEAVFLPVGIIKNKKGVKKID